MVAGGGCVKWFCSEECKAAADAELFPDRECETRGVPWLRSLMEQVKE